MSTTELAKQTGGTSPASTTGRALDAGRPAGPAGGQGMANLELAATASLNRFAAGLSALVLSGLVAADALSGTAPARLLLPGLAAAACGLLGAGRLPWPAERLRATFPPLLVTVVLGVAVDIRMSAGGPGPTSEEAVLAALLILDVAVAFGVLLAAGVTLLAGWFGLQEALANRPGDALLRTPLAGAVTVGQVALGGVVAGLIVAGFRRSAAGVQASADRADQTLAAQRAAEAAQAADAEAARTLHDTALNTLEAIAKATAIDPELVRDRCRRDLQALGRWRSGHADIHADGQTQDDLGASLAALAAHARGLGLRPLVHGPTAADAPAAVPAEVVAAMLAAATEAITNTAKHSGCDQVDITLQLADAAPAATLTVCDPGGAPHLAGPGGWRQPVAPGFGVTESIVGRMTAVGGTATCTREPTGGMCVRLHWSGAPEPANIDDAGRDVTGAAQLNRVAADVFAWSGLAAALVCLVLLGIGWGSFTRPWVALAAVLLPAVALVWVWRGGRSPAIAAVVAGGGYVVATLAGPLADPYCASVFAERIALDARLAALAVVLLLLPSTAAALAILATVLVTQLFVAEMWHLSFPLCGSGSQTAAVLVACLVMAVWWFGRLAGRMSATTNRARAAALSAQVSARCAQLARQQRQRWDAAALGRAEGLLGEIVAGDAQPTQPAVVARCAREASYLRGLLLVGRAGQWSTQLRLWLASLRAEGTHVIVRGNFSGLDLPQRVVEEVGAVVDWLVAGPPARAVEVTAWSDPVSQGFTISAEVGPGKPPSLQSGWVDCEAGVVTVGWDWDAPSGSAEEVAR